MSESFAELFEQSLQDINMEPGAIVAAAFRASREDLEGLLAVARESGSAHVVAVGDHPLLAGHNTPL